MMDTERLYSIEAETNTQNSLSTKQKTEKAAVTRFFLITFCRFLFLQENG